MMTTILPEDLALDSELLTFVEQDDDLLLKVHGMDDSMLLDDVDLDLDLNGMIEEDQRALLASDDATCEVDKRTSPAPIETDHEDSEKGSIGMPSPLVTPHPAATEQSNSPMEILNWPSSPHVDSVRSDGHGAPSGGESDRDMTSDDDEYDEELAPTSNADGLKRKSKRKTAASVKRSRQTSEEDLETEFELLRKEATYLAAHYDYLVSKTRSTKEYRALAKQRRKAQQQQLQSLNQTTKDNAILNQLLQQQKVYVENFRAMLSFAPVNDIRMSLMTPMDVYIHLGQDADERQRTIMRVREEKLDATFKYIEHKSRGLNVEEPHHYFDVFEKFGKVYSTTFMINKFENVTVHQVLRLIIEQTADPDDSLARAMGCLTIKEDLGSQRCSYLHQKVLHTYDEAETSAFEIPSLESNSLFFCKDSPDVAVLAVDSVDKDDLHPFDEKAGNIRKDLSCGMVLSPYRNENGTEGVIVKRFFLAKFNVQTSKVPEKVQEFLMSKIPVLNDKFVSMFSPSALKRAAAEFPRVCA